MMETTKTQRLTVEETSYILGLFASRNMLMRIAGTQRMETRLKMIPNGWRDLKMMFQRIDWLCVKLMETIPEEKRETLAVQMQGIHYKIYTHMDAAPPKDYALVNTSQYDTVCIAAHEQCMLCGHPERCKSCQLGKALDAHLPFSRTKSYAYIDLADVILGNCDNY